MRHHRVNRLVEGEIGGINGIFYAPNRWIQLALQLYGIVVSLGWSAVVSLAILYSIQFTFGLRVSELDEKLGLDITTHGEVIDNPEELIGSKKKTSEIVSLIL
jgi:ammonia channel protein AmtB